MESMIFSGVFDLSWVGYVVVALLLTHVTIASVTIFLHRHQAHRALDLHPVVSHFFRLWLWLTTGMVTREWAAVHRKHHQASDTPTDPHSPQIYGIWTVLFKGAFLYMKAKKDPEVMKLGVGTPNDWIERNVYTRLPWQGVGLMLVVNLALFGALGLTVAFIVGQALAQRQRVDREHRGRDHRAVLIVVARKQMTLQVRIHGRRHHEMPRVPIQRDFSHCSTFKVFNSGVSKAASRWLDRRETWTAGLDAIEPITTMPG